MSAPSTTMRTPPSTHASGIILPPSWTLQHSDNAQKCGVITNTTGTSPPVLTHVYPSLQPADNVIVHKPTTPVNSSEKPSAAEPDQLVDHPSFVGVDASHLLEQPNVERESYKRAAKLLDGSKKRKYITTTQIDDVDQPQVATDIAGERNTSPVSSTRSRRINLDRSRRAKLSKGFEALRTTLARHGVENALELDHVAVLKNTLDLVAQLETTIQQNTTTNVNKEEVAMAAARVQTDCIKKPT